MTRGLLNPLADCGQPNPSSDARGLCHDVSACPICASRERLAGSGSLLQPGSTTNLVEGSSAATARAMPMRWLPVSGGRVPARIGYPPHVRGVATCVWLGPVIECPLGFSTATPALEGIRIPVHQCDASAKRVPRVAMARHRLLCSTPT